MTVVFLTEKTSSGKDAAMSEWAGRWWCVDAPYLIRLFWESFSSKSYVDDSWYANDLGLAEQIQKCLGISPNLNMECEAVQKTVDAVVNEIRYSIDKGPERAFICLDSGTSARKKLDPLYKRCRSPLPAEYWGCYFALIRELQDDLGEHAELVVSPDWEADDCLATIAKRAVVAGKQCIMMVTDKDLRQCLVHGKVNMQRRVKNKMGVPSWDFFTARHAEIDWQVMSDRFLEVQMLAGDATDRIQGCRGIAIPSAAKLLNEYGSIEKMKLRDSFPVLKRRDYETNLLEYLKKDVEKIRPMVELRTDLTMYNPFSEEEVVF